MISNSTEIYIFDLDGTVANCDHRRHYVEGKRKDWNAFYLASSEDVPNEDVCKIFRNLQKSGATLAILSGRSDLVQETTIAWLKCHDVPPNILMMREEGDTTPDEVLKKHWLYQILESNAIDKSAIKGVFDDRQKVVDMWRAEGLTCFQVAPGDF